MKKFETTRNFGILCIFIFFYSIEKNEMFTNTEILGEECKSISTIKSQPVKSRKNVMQFADLRSGPRSRQTYDRHK